MFTWFNGTMNEEHLRKKIRCLLDEIRNEADPVVLNRCRSIFRQEVSFFHRSYMAAYLLLLSEGYISGKKPGGKERLGSRKEEGRTKAREERARMPRTGSTAEAETMRALSEEESVRLFISIGRNRKAFPREILALITSKAGINRDDIGIIRTLDNYSFIQVRQAAADSVIQALNGQVFRGRTLTVNYARTKRDGEEANDEVVQTAPSADDA